MIIDFKKPIVVSILLLTALNTQRSSAQHIYVEQGKNTSNFKYINPKGESLDHLLYTSNDYMAIGIKTNLLQFFKKGFIRQGCQIYRVFKLPFFLHSSRAGNAEDVDINIRHFLKDVSSEDLQIR